jgi:hypothetical protein
VTRRFHCFEVVVRLITQRSTVQIHVVHQKNKSTPYSLAHMWHIVMRNPSKIAFCRESRSQSTRMLTLGSLNSYGLGTPSHTSTLVL